MTSRFPPLVYYINSLPIVTYPQIKESYINYVPTARRTFLIIFDTITNKAFSII